VVLRAKSIIEKIESHKKEPGEPSNGKKKNVGSREQTKPLNRHQEVITKLEQKK